MKNIIIALSLALISLPSFANLIKIDEQSFNPEHTESFESLWGAYTFHENESVFGGLGTATGHGEWMSNNFLSVWNGGWDVETVSNGSMRLQTADGIIHVAIGGWGFFRVDFNVDVFAFGGYFSNAYLNQSTIITFLDQNNDLIEHKVFDTQSIAGEMNWSGYESERAIGAVLFSGQDTSIDNLMIRTSSMEISEPPMFILVLFSLVCLSRRVKL